MTKITEIRISIRILFQIHNFQEILVRDAKLKPDAVKTMLKYIYSDFKDVADIENASVSVWDVLYAGNNFALYQPHQQQLLMLIISYEQKCLLSIQTDNFFSLSSY